MLGLILIFFVGKAFYDLAKKYEKNKWLFAILGVASYYIGLLLTAFVIGLIIGIYYPEYLDGSSDFLLGLSAIPFGVLICYLFYYFLKRSWAAQPPPVSDLNTMVNEFGSKEEDRNYE